MAISSEAERALVEHFLLLRSQERQDETLRLAVCLRSSDLAVRGCQCGDAPLGLVAGRHRLRDCVVKRKHSPG